MLKKKIAREKIIFNILSLQLSENSLKCNIFVIIVLSMAIQYVESTH